MKKKMIAAGAASLALAAMPVVGVFAEDYTPIVDTVEVTVQSPCAMWTGVDDSTPPQKVQTGGYYTASVPAGTLVTPEAGTGNVAWGASSAPKTITFSCNDAGGWKVTAQGINSATATGASVRTNMVGSSTQKTIATGTADSGAASAWAFKVAGSGVTIANGYGNWSAIPGETPGILAESTNDAPISEATITPSYRVWVSSTQEADTYTGYVKYVLTAPLSVAP